MNWETYKTLNDDQRKEYDYKYNKNRVFNIIPALNTTTMLILTIMLMLTMLAFVSTSGISPDIEERIPIYMTSIGALIKILAPTLIVYLLYESISVVWHHISELRWLYKNNIKRQGKWWRK